MLGVTWLPPPKCRDIRSAVLESCRLYITNHLLEIWVFWGSFVSKTTALAMKSLLKLVVSIDWKSLRMSPLTKKFEAHPNEANRISKLVSVPIRLSLHFQKWSQFGQERSVSPYLFACSLLDLPNLVVTHLRRIASDLILFLQKISVAIFFQKTCRQSSFSKNL